MRVVVQKFGGSLLESPGGRLQVAELITATRRRGRANDARILRIAPTRARAHLERDRVVVVAGFQGVTPDGEVTTLGRGGSDTTAVAMGAALDAEVVEIYKDVEGIMTADPKLVPGARPIRRITYDEMSQLAALGARVLHPREADIGREHNVRLIIRRMGDRMDGMLVVT